MFGLRPFKSVCVSECVCVCVCVCVSVGEWVSASGFGNELEGAQMS